MSRTPGPRWSAALLAASMLIVATVPIASGQESSPAPSSSPPASPVASAAPSIDPLAGVELVVRGSPDPTLEVPAEDLVAVVQGNTAFALDLYRQIAGKDGNVVLGPLSVSVALAMEQLGARGDTAAQMASTLHLDLPADRLAAAFAVLDRELEGLAGPEVTIRIVNQLFGQTRYPFEEPFLEALSSRFDAPMALVDYTDTESVRQLINAWVASKTADHIKDLLAPGILTDTTKLAVVNATYLKADWAEPFEAAFTKPRVFHPTPVKSVRVPTMTAESSFPFMFGEGYQALELPYDGDRLAMLIVMPSDLTAFDRSLTAETLDQIVAGLEMRLLDLKLPRFSARTTVDLVTPLRALGIVDAFDPTLADLTGISADGLSVDAIVHQAFVAVAEKGTEVAAATVVATGDSGTEIPPLDVRINRPFLWFIRDRETGSVLFMGRVTDPRASAE